MESGRPATNGEFHDSDAQGARKNFSLSGVNGNSYEGNFGQNQLSGSAGLQSEYYFPESFANPTTSWGFTDPSGPTPVSENLNPMEQFSSMTPNNFMNSTANMMDPQYFYSNSAMSQGMNSNTMLNSMQFRPQFASYSMSPSSMPIAKSLPTNLLNQQHVGSRMQPDTHSMGFQSPYQNSQSQDMSQRLSHSQRHILQQSQLQASLAANKRLSISGSYGNGSPQQLRNIQRPFTTLSQELRQEPTQIPKPTQISELSNNPNHAHSSEGGEITGGLNTVAQHSMANAQRLSHDSFQSSEPNNVQSTIQSSQPNNTQPFFQNPQPNNTQPIFQSSQSDTTQPTFQTPQLNNSPSTFQSPQPNNAQSTFQNSQSKNIQSTFQNAQPNSTPPAFHQMGQPPTNGENHFLSGNGHVNIQKLYGNSNQTGQEGPFLSGKPIPQSHQQHSSTNAIKELRHEKTPSRLSTPQEVPPQNPSCVNEKNLELLRAKCLESREDFFKILKSVAKTDIDSSTSVMCAEQPIDLHSLWTQVVSRGGITECGRSKGWVAIRDALGLDLIQSKVPSRLKNTWKKYLQGLESALYPDHHIPSAAKKAKKTHSDQPAVPHQAAVSVSREMTPNSSTPAISSIVIEPSAISQPNTLTNIPARNQTRLQPPAQNLPSPYPVKPVSKPTPKTKPKPKVVRPPRTTPYDYIPFVRKVDTVGGIDLTALQTSSSLHDYGMLTGEIRIYDITMALHSQLPSCVSQALFTLLNLSHDPSVGLVLSQCQHLTQVLLLILAEDYERLFPGSETGSDLASGVETEVNSVSLHKDLCRQFTDEALYIPKRQSEASLFISNPAQRAAIVCLIICNLSFFPANQSFLAEQSDLLLMMFQFSHASLPDALEITISLRKYLLILASNILEFWRCDKESDPKSGIKPLFTWFLDLCCEFFDQPLPLYPSMAWECLVKLATLDVHREIMSTAKYTEHSNSILSHLSTHLQRLFTCLDEEPFDESRIIYLQYMLMSAPHLIKAALVVPRGLLSIISNIISWLVGYEIKERQQRQFRPKAGGASRAAIAQAEEREALIVGLIVRGLLAIQALTQRSTASLEFSSILTHHSVLIELMTLPLLHPHVAGQLNMLLHSVEEVMNRAPSRTQPFKNES